MRAPAPTTSESRWPCVLPARPRFALGEHRRQPIRCAAARDRGAFGQRCAEIGITPSRASPGDCFDNSMPGSFFAPLECELIDRTRFATRHEADLVVVNYIESRLICRVLRRAYGHGLA